MSMNFDLSEEHRIFWDAIASFVDKEIGPLVDEAEAKEEYFNETIVKRWGQGFDRKAPLRGTPSDIIRQVWEYRDTGVDYFIVRFMGGDFQREATVFAEQVLSEV